MKKKKEIKLKKIQLTQQEIWDSLKVPAPHKSKKDFKRKPKHKRDEFDNWHPDVDFP
tara:strand:- start:245 stop:415 length:171 start_codon:yes stop_codon:yes gene_type:complete